MKTRTKLAVVFAGLAMTMGAQALVQKPCDVANDSLKRNGFTQNAIYSGASMNHFLHDVLKISADSPFRDDMNYRGSFSCVGPLHNNAARGTLTGLTVVPVGMNVPADATMISKVDTVSSVSWEFSR